MPISAVEPLYENVAIEFRGKRWTRDECVALEAAGLLDPTRFELIEGELVDRMEKKRPHAIALSKVLYWLARVFGEDYVQPETPIDVSPADQERNEPEPDVIVLKQPMTAYRDGNVPALELRLVVEISDISLGLDLRRKGRLYARAGIAEYWVVDIPNRRLIVHRQPEDGTYHTVLAYLEHEAVAPLASPGTLFEVRTAFA